MRTESNSEQRSPRTVDLGLSPCVWGAVMQTAWPERTPAYGGAGEITGQRRGSESEELGQAGKQLQAFPHCRVLRALGRLVCSLPLWGRGPVLPDQNPFPWKREVHSKNT